MTLEKELATYERHRAVLLAREGKYAVVHGRVISWHFDTYEDALKFGYDRYGLGPFLVREISRVEPIHHVSCGVVPA